MSYLRFGAMIVTSAVVMFVLMYLNTYAWEHVFFSETRVYMALLMAATMAAIMLAFMLGMYRNGKANAAIFAGAAIAFALTLWLVRSQATVDQVSYMRAMIPHHSIAIMTSERAEITDPRVRKLADEIIDAQRREISEMRYLIAALEGQDDPPPPALAGEPRAELAPPEEAIETTVIALLDPATMEEAEIGAVLPQAGGCRFLRTAASEPILAVAPAAEAERAQGVMKLNGKLVALEGGQEAAGTPAKGVRMRAGGIAMAVTPLPGAEPEEAGGRLRREADLVFSLERGLTVGYRGFWDCAR